MCSKYSPSISLIAGNHPTGTTNGVSWLAARVQSTIAPPNAPIVTDPWVPIGRNGAYWISTDSRHFPAGTFWNGQLWTRSTVIAFDTHGLAYHRTQWLIQFADGHQEYRYTTWVFC